MLPASRPSTQQQEVGFWKGETRCHKVRVGIPQMAHISIYIYIGIGIGIDIGIDIDIDIDIDIYVHTQIKM